MNMTGLSSILVYCVDIDLMTETYYVWDNEECVNVGEFCEMEVEDLLNEINKNA